MNEEVLTKEEKKPHGIRKFASYTTVKILAFLAIIFFTITTMGGTVIFVGLWNEGIYSEGHLKEIASSRFDTVARLNANMIASYVQGKETDAAKAFILERNIAGVEIDYIGYPYDSDGNSLKHFEFYRNNEYKQNPPTTYVCEGFNGDIEWTIYVIPELPADDAYLSAYQTVQKLYELRWPIVGLVAISALFLLLSLIILLVGIGRRPDKYEVVPNASTRIPFDIFTVLIGLVCIFLGLLVDAASYNIEIIGVIIFGILCLIIMLWVVNIVHRIKLRNLFSNTLCWMFIKFVWKLVCNINLIWQALIVLTAVSFLEFLFIVFVGLAGKEVTALIILFFWFFEKCIVIPVLLYFVLMMKNLFKGGEKIAEGNLDYKINLSGLFGAYKKHGQNLNNLSEVINNAVSEQLKSERMKSELVTNVSHDLKTPLTSVINYSDLIHTEANNLIEIDKEADHDNTNTDNNDNISAHLANIEEYSQVLNRQSNKLKRLLEDLVDISKANSGNMEVLLEKLNVATILSQAIGEYEERFEEKNLEVVANGIEEDIYVVADSRKLWRVFDNLLGNICKYALSGTRVFLSAEKKDGTVCIVFKNTSRDIITVSPEELAERFTRNDDSRHTEGNGLGLAIAKTMTELQEGNFKLEIDGDLFKVTLSLKEYTD
ncbi:MAG: HAMP domain-containing histidine kinase [Lachnospiraceae bacterium]|nr:HAMP domain-containing histidine kinase [Lachnospiraceae bacterium]